MRINKFLAQSTNLSRRKADEAITDGRVEINEALAVTGDLVIDSDIVKLDGEIIKNDTDTKTIMFHKPVGYVVSKSGQGSKTIYDLLPKKLHQLNPVGRLDKNSSGLLLLTNDGNLANQLTHPKFKKEKVYLVELSDFLNSNDDLALKKGVNIGDKTLSKLDTKQMNSTKPEYQVKISEGRNRQIRRTFKAIGLEVIKLHRIEFGPYKLGDLKVSKFRQIDIIAD